jgi:methylmalonyl-CoA mutase N-terminal domain/subunit
VANTVDPLAGSYYLEAMPDRLEAQTYECFDRIDRLGGVIPAIEAGFFQREIGEYREPVIV